MNRRLAQELADALAKQMNWGKKESEAFLKTYFGLIEEGILQDGEVKVKGLGTFKLLSVEARQSVDVNTGEPIQIAPHRKLTFIPDAALKEEINKPFAGFEPVNLDETAPEQSIPLENEEETISDVGTETVSPSEKTHSPEAEFTGFQPNQTVKASDSPHHSMVWVAIAFALLAVGGLIYWSMWSNRTWQAELDRKRHLLNDYQSIIPMDSLQTDSTVNFTVSNSSFRDTIIMPPGGRLTLLSLNYYGHKAFWVYIYLANKSHITDPDRIPAGTVLLIPKPDSVWMNPNNPEAIGKALAMQAALKLGK